MFGFVPNAVIIYHPIVKPEPTAHPPSVCSRFSTPLLSAIVQVGKQLVSQKQAVFPLGTRKEAASFLLPEETDDDAVTDDDGLTGF